MTVPVSTLAPGFFTLGPAVPGATAVRVSADGTQTPVSVTTALLTSIKFAPIDVSAGTVYLTLYGTGFAQASTSATTCSVGNVSVPVTYTGPQIEFPGLGQVNILLPGSLAGGGLQPVSCLFQRLAVPALLRNGVRALRLRAKEWNRASAQSHSVTF
jgi:uncharacterized protein (TIGR03437 family)